MLDKIEVRVPYSAVFCDGFRFFSSELRLGDARTPAGRSMNYTAVYDLRPFEIEAMLHLYLKRGKTRKNHKLELLHTGRKSLKVMRESIERVFRVDGNEMELMRVDWAADCEGVTLPQAHASIRVKYKRSTDCIGKLDYEMVGKRRLEYFRYGKSPNCFRVYDKPAECAARLPGLLKKANPDAEPPSFEELFGFSRNTILTRFERQTGGRGIPVEFKRFGDLRKAADYNPFENVEVCDSAFFLPEPSITGPARSIKIAGIHAYIQAYGFQQARAALNCDNNAARLFSLYEAHVNETSSGPELTQESLRESYRTSVLNQIDGTVDRVVAA